MRIQVLMISSMVLATSAALAAQDEGSDRIPGTAPLELRGELHDEMLRGMDAYLTRALEGASAARERSWRPDLSSLEAYLAWARPRRERLATISGVADSRVAPRLEIMSPKAGPVGRGAGYVIHAVRWAALDGLQAEGLLLEPDSPAASVIAVPDADHTPEQLAGLERGVPPASQFARRLAESGCRVLVPALIDRRDTHSGNPQIRLTNQPHREYVYRGAYEMGRHVIGYEVQEVLAGVDWFRSRWPDAPVGVAGYGEGGLLALSAAAIDPRIDAVLVSGYFGPRERVWSEPIYRNVWSLLRDFGDAEVLALIAPRAAVIEASRHPAVAGPPAPREGRTGAAPGRIETPDIEAVRAEFERVRKLLPQELTARFELLEPEEGGLPGSAVALAEFLHALHIYTLAPDGSEPERGSELVDSDVRLRRVLEGMNAYTDRLAESSAVRRRAFWDRHFKAGEPDWHAATEPLRRYFHEQAMGRLPDEPLPLRARSRLREDRPRWRMYEVSIDVVPGVIAGGLLLIPKDLRAGERRPVVVCQHGLEGRASYVIAEEGPGFGPYRAYAARLADRGYVVYAPQNPYIGGDAFRVLQRKANPLGLSLFSFIVAQHRQTLRWLATLPYVDAGRTGLYGLSYGGKTAMRVPALLPEYALSICSADFNEWILKNVSRTYESSYRFTGEYEMPEFNLGETFGYAEMAGLIAPRPFMVERGRQDPVGRDDWVAAEFEKVKPIYARAGRPENAEIEYFDGRHQINGVGTFAFLDRHLHFTPTSRPADQ